MKHYFFSLLLLMTSLSAHCLPSEHPSHQDKSTRQVVFDAVVDANFSADNTSVRPAQFTSIQAAIKSSNGTSADRYVIFVKPGTYQGHIVIDRPYVTIVGQSASLVRITDNKPTSAGGVDKTSTINVNAPDVSLDNLTIENTMITGGQALALYTKNDRITVSRCNLIGWQDTYRTGKNNHRHLVRRCKISGTTDFIYSGGDVYFESDTLVLRRTGNVIVAPKNTNPAWGYVFRDAVITSAVGPAKTFLGRPWGETPKVTFINTRLSADVTINPIGWDNMGGLPLQMADYGTKRADGSNDDVSGRRTTFISRQSNDSAASIATISDAEAAKYTLSNVLSGADGWNADEVAKILLAPVAKVNKKKLTWTDASGEASCFLITCDGKSSFTTSTSMRCDETSTVTIQAVNKYGVLGEATCVNLSSRN